MARRTTRRKFLQKSTGVTGATLGSPYFFTPNLFGTEDSAATKPVDRLKLGCIGTGSRWGAVGPNAMKFSDCVAVCDVDASHVGSAAQRVEKIQNTTPKVYEDYQRILDRKDIDVVTIVTTDHWHSKIAIEAMQAGKDVYCEKPLSLTIDEGKKICQVAKDTKRVFQVGTQQRSEMGLRFLQAVAIIRAGRIGDVQKVHVAIGGSPTSGAIPVATPPSHLNWEKWLGQAPLVDYRINKEGGRKTRCHYEFRWWYEYSGGKLTDWGAHHVDIGQWGIDQLGEGQGPLALEPLMVEHPMEFKAGQPTLDDRYNTATKFNIKVLFPNNIEMYIRQDCKDLGFDNGLMFEGTKGRFIVNRGKIAGQAIDALKDNPLPEGLLNSLYKGKEPGGGNAHMRNFFDCIKTREDPISDVFTHHRALTTCHLSNIALRLNRSIQWDPALEQIVGDDEANAWQAREQRAGYEIVI
ncbi:MAG: Gfo/Idh/MocA family oxidoreductase [Pirellulaceae bacterium]|nr:Gfo/Idh/MocA family oxidoreductase [Pirellulaceae bacterium]